MVKVYYGRISLLQEQEIFHHYLEQVNKQRRNKVLRYKKEEDQKRSLLAGLLLEHALKQEKIWQEDLLISETPYGKPYIENLKGLCFNISHSGEYAVCAVSDKTIGADVETHARLFQNPQKQSLWDTTARRCFSEAEYAYYERISRSSDFMEKAEVFLKFWTRKESYSKAVGKGLGMDFSKIDVMSDAAETSFWSDWLAEGYYLSLYQENIRSESILLLEVEVERDV